MSIINPSSLRILEDLLDDFLPYAKEQYGYEQTPTIRFAKDPDNAKNPLGKTGYYEPDHSRITIYIDGRHPKDIMRSISHELVHHAQNGRGDLAGTQGVGEQGYAQNNEHLREMEREAYERGNLCFRDWEDGIKSENPNMYESLKRNLKESRFAATASEEAQKINSQAGIRLNTDQAYWEKVGVRTGEELAIEILTGTYSDMFKSIHNVRPRRSFASIEEVEAAIDRLDGEMEAAVEQQKLDAQAEEEYRKNQELIASLMPNEYDVQYDKLPKQSGMGRAAMQEHKEELNMFDRRDVKLNQRLMESFGYKLKEEAYVGEGEIPVSSGQVASVGFKRGYYFWRHTNGLMNSYDNEGKFFMSLRDAGLGMSEANELLLQINDQQRQKAGGIQSGHDMSDEERRAMYDDESLSDYSGVMQEGYNRGKYRRGEDNYFDDYNDPYQNEVDQHWRQCVKDAEEHVTNGTVDQERMKHDEFYQTAVESEIGNRNRQQKGLNEMPMGGDFQVGEFVYIIDGGLRGATGKIAEPTTLVTGEQGYVIHLYSDADKKVFGKQGDEVIAGASKIRSGGTFDGSELYDIDERRGLREGSMAEYGKIDAEDGNPPSKIGHGTPEYMESYNAVLVARGEEPLPIVQPDQAYIDALQSGNLSNDFSKRSVSEARPDFMGSDEEEQMMSKMSASDHYKYVTQDRGKREMSPDEINAIESFNNWLNDKNAGDHHMRQMTWEPAQSYRGGRVLAYNKKEGTWLDVMNDMPVSDEEMSDILPEAKLQAALKAKLSEVFAKHPQLAENKEFINNIKLGVKTLMENKDMKTRTTEGVQDRIDDAAAGQEKEKGVADRAKEGGKKTDVVALLKHMFKSPETGNALAKIKGDQVEVAEFMGEMAKALGLDAAGLKQMSTRITGNMGERLAEGVVNNLKERGYDAGSLFDDPMDPTLDDDYEEEYGLGSSAEDEDIEALLRQYGLDKGAASDEEAPADIQRQMDDEFGGVEDEEEEIPARRATVMKEDDGEYAHIGIKTTQDEYGALHILPGVQFTGDIAADVKQCQQNDELDSWLYGELGSDENITDVAGKIVYAGADVQDHVGAEEDYDGSYQPRMAESNDEDGDGDVDSDDYMAKKDKAIKKASGEEDDEKKEESFDRFHSNKRNTRLNETLMKWAIK